MKETGVGRCCGGSGDPPGKSLPAKAHRQNREGAIVLRTAFSWNGQRRSCGTYCTTRLCVYVSTSTLHATTRKLENLVFFILLYVYVAHSCYAAPPLLEFWPRTCAEGGEGPARARMENRDRLTQCITLLGVDLKK